MKEDPIKYTAYSFPGCVMRDYKRKVTISVEEYDRLRERAELAEVMLQEKPKTTRIRMPEDEKFDMICAYVASEYFLNVASMLAPGRNPKNVRARQLIMYLCTFLGLTTVYVAERMGKDHTTVIYSRDLVKSDMEVYEDVKLEVNGLAAGLWGRLIGKDNDNVGAVESCGS